MNNTVYALTSEWNELKNEYFDWLDTSEESLNMTEWARQYKGIEIINRNQKTS